jgi:peptide subunit release factor 1 (eRF1)
MLVQSRYQRHLTEHRGRHLDAVAEAVTAMVEQDPATVVVVAGDTRTAAVFRTHLTAPVAERVVGTVVAARHEPSSVLVERAVDIVDRARSDDSAMLAALLAEAEGAGRAAAGVETVLAAANRGVIERLYLLEAFRDPGRVCGACGAVQGAADVACRFCGKATSEIDLGETLARRTIASDGLVHAVRTHAGLAAAGGIAARLRHPL